MVLQSPHLIIYPQGLSESYNPRRQCCVALCCYVYPPRLPTNGPRNMTGGKKISWTFPRLHSQDFPLWLACYSCLLSETYKELHLLCLWCWLYAVNAAGHTRTHLHIQQTLTAAFSWVPLHLAHLGVESQFLFSTSWMHFVIVPVHLVFIKVQKRIISYT